MLFRQLRQRMQRAIPVIAWLVRIDCSGVDYLAGGVDYRHLDAGAQAGVEPHGGARSGWRCQQQCFQVECKNVDRLDLGFFPQLRHQFGFQMHENLDAPAPADRVAQPFVGAAALVADAEAGSDASFARIVRRIPFRFFFFGIETQHYVQDFFAAATEQRQRPVRWNGADGFRIVEVVGEFFAGILLAFYHFRFDYPVFGQIFAQRLQQRGIFRKTLHQDLAGAVECRLGIGYARIVAVVGAECRLQVFIRFLFWIQIGISQQCIGQLGQTGFGGDLRLGAAFEFVRQVQVFEPGLVFRQADCLQQCRGHFALFLNRGQDRAAAHFQLAQVTQALFQQAQLDIVQAASGFLAVASDKRHGGAFVQKGDGSGDLRRFGGKFKGETLFDRRQHGDS